MRLREISKILHYDVEKKAIDRKAKLSKEKASTKPEWSKEVEGPEKSRYLVYLTIGTFLFFLTAIATTYFVRYAGIDRTISESKITLITQGPASADSGLGVPLIIRVANRNPVAIQGTILTVKYPEGTFKMEENGTVTHLRWSSFSLEEVKTGSIINTPITPIFYGENGEKKTITYELDYSIVGVAEPIKVSGSHEVLLRTEPVLVDGPNHTETIEGKDVVFSADIQSNFPTDLPLTIVRMSYPEGFEAKRFTPTTSEAYPEGAEWQITTLRPGVSKSLKVSGTIRKSINTQKVVLLSVLVSPTGKQEDAVQVASGKKILTVERSFLDMNLSLNGEKSDHIAVSSGSTVQGKIQWKNQDSNNLRNLVITATLTGSGLDKDSVSPSEGGVFEEEQNRIVWNKRSSDDLANLHVGERGNISFSFRMAEDRIESPQRQKFVRINLSARALRETTGRVEQANDIAIGNVFVISTLQVVANTLYATSEIRNSGPIPPQADRTTTYALKYFFKNQGNEVSDVVINIPLGKLVELTNTVLGVGVGEWEYDEDAHEVTVRIPALSASGERSSRSVEIQVAVRPRFRDIGKHLVLAKRATYTARDTYVDEMFEEKVKELTTRITAEQVDETRVVE